MKWTKAQQKIIEARNCNLLVSAAAGSGKTAVLVERIIQMISDTEHPMNIDELLVVTFTKAAAAQMRDKIAEELEKKLEKEPSNAHYIRQLNYIQKANILTIDSFCYQVVKEHFHVLGIDPGICVGEVGELGLLKAEVMEKVMEDAYEKNEDFVSFSEAFSADKTDSNIENYLLKVYDICSSYPRPEEWIRKAKEGLHITDEEGFLQLSFVSPYFEEIRGAAKGVKERIQQALELTRGLEGPLHMENAILSDIMMIEDVISAKSYSHFHGVANLPFARLGRGKKGDFDEEIAEEVKQIRDGYKKEIKSLLAPFAFPFQQVLEQFEKQENMLRALLEVTEDFRKQFLEAKLQQGIMEFSDVEHFALQILCKGYDEEGEPIASDIGKEMSESFREILIDEYQDSNFLQEAILKCVSRLHQGEHNIFMVGDVKQSIYRFRMARPDLFMEKYRTYDMAEGSPCRKLLLKNNFRSRSNVLETINYMFYQIMGEDLGGIAYTNEEALVPGKEFLTVADDSVELLLGESKGFEFLSLKDEEMTAEKDERLDEKLEDIARKELEASIVARKILVLLGKEGDKPHQIVDKDSGVLRDVRLGDMVILFRAPSGYQQIFSEVLLDYGIPVKVQNETGYFDTTELQVIMSLLKVIDNPHNDVEVAAVLRSYFVGCSSDELALLSLLKRAVEKKEKKKLALFQILHYVVQKRADALAEWREVFSDAEDVEGLISPLYEKSERFVKLVEEFQTQKMQVSISRLVSDIYYKTGYYYYVEAMPEGRQRVRNLDLFFTECKNFEGNGARTLFEWLLFVEQIQKRAIALGGDPALDGTEDVVRIMSIHKSKGLEFPVVFLSGIGKGFHLMDTKTPLILHSDYYVGAKYVDTKRRCGNDTFARKAIAALMITENLAEELRLLYVALTRAKEKLILTGVTPDVTALVRKYKALANKEEQSLSYSVVHTAENYLDFVVMAMIRNESFHAAMQSVKKRLHAKTGEILSAEYTLSAPVKLPDINLKVRVYDYNNLAIQHLQSNVERQSNRQQQYDLLLHSPSKYEEPIRERLQWQYEKWNYSLQKSKMSVTEIKRMYEIDFTPTDVVAQLPVLDDMKVFPVPRFVAGEQPMSAADRGTWMHKLMELFPNAEISEKKQVEEFLEDMWRSNRLPEETRAFITTDKVFSFATSNLGKRMREAAKRGQLYKEKQFVVGVEPSRILRGDEEREEDEIPVVVQGIIDAYFVEDGNLILLDYKTDKIKEGQEDILLERYRTQLQYYKDTLKQLTGMRVTEIYIYSFALDREILCKLA